MASDSPMSIVLSSLQAIPAWAVVEVKNRVAVLYGYVMVVFPLSSLLRHRMARVLQWCLRRLIPCLSAMIRPMVASSASAFNVQCADRRVQCANCWGVKKKLCCFFGSFFTEMRIDLKSQDRCASLALAVFRWVVAPIVTSSVTKITGKTFLRPQCNFNFFLKDVFVRDPMCPVYLYRYNEWKPSF
jgi:hypothetical protein